MTAEYWEGAPEVDGQAMDELAYLFARCRELGVEVSEHMPLGTPACQRAAVIHLSNVIVQARMRREGLG